MSTKEEPGPFDGLERAAPNEPVFTLRGNDSLAHDLIMLWVDRRRKLIGEIFGRGDMDEGQRELVENSWRDDYWGWGQNRDGQNMLGKLWMELRDEIATPPSDGKEQQS